MPSPLFYLGPALLLLFSRGRGGVESIISGGPFIDSLPKDRGQIREAMILNEVTHKLAENDWDASNIAWTTVRSQYGNLIADIPVMTDALRLDGVRVNTNFTTGQRIADAIGVYQLAPHVANLINAQSGIWITPSPKLWLGKGTDESGTQTRRMIEHSRIVDRKVSSVGEKALPGRNPFLLNNPGKYWVNSQRNWEKNRLYGANYGWYQKDGGMIQGPIPGLWHTLDHVDYSQVFRAMGSKAMLSHALGNFEPHEVSLETLIAVPETAPLITGKESLPELRHPGISKVPIIA